MDKKKIRRKFTLVKGAILTGTLIFSMTGIKYIDKKNIETIPYTQEDLQYKEYIEQELNKINNEDISFNNKELYDYLLKITSKETLTREDLNNIKTLNIDIPLNNNNLEDLKYLQNLSTLSINQMNIDVSNIKYNINLYNVAFNNCNLVNINDLPNNINNIILTNCNINDSYFNTPFDLKTLLIRNTLFNNLHIKNPSNLEELLINTKSLFDCNSILECSNLKDLEISRSSNVINSKKLTELKKTNITLDDYASIWIDKETLSNINLTKTDQNNRTKEEIDKIDEIITSLNLSQNDEETKIKKITIYVINWLDYDQTEDLNSIYNDYPMYYALNQNKGICINYTSLWQALANRAGIKNYSMFNDYHTWNYIDNKFYIDPTYLDTSTVVKIKNDEGDSELANISNKTSLNIMQENNEKILYFYELNIDDELDKYHDYKNKCVYLEGKIDELNNIGYVNPNSIGRIMMNNQVKLMKTKVAIITLLTLLLAFKSIDKIEKIKLKKLDEITLN